MAFMDLWTLFVIEIFGGFWFAFFGLSLIMFLILMFGGVSPMTSIRFLEIWVYAMMFGYNFTLGLIIFIVLLAVEFVPALIKKFGGEG